MFIDLFDVGAIKNNTCNIWGVKSFGLTNMYTDVLEHNIWFLVTGQNDPKSKCPLVKMAPGQNGPTSQNIQYKHAKYNVQIRCALYLVVIMAGILTDNFRRLGIREDEYGITWFIFTSGVLM